MLNFDQFNKKKEKEYEIVKSRSGLPMFVLDSPFTQDDDEDNEVEVITDLELDIDMISGITKFHSRLREFYSRNEVGLN